MRKGGREGGREGGRVCGMLCVLVFVSFRQLLHDCGIGVEGEGEGGLASAVGQHRILIFCQFKGILDIIENDLFK